jgi:hypothetical protein
LTAPNGGERLDADQIIDAALQALDAIDGWLEFDFRFHWSDHRLVLRIACDVASVGLL